MYSRPSELCEAFLRMSEKPALQASGNSSIISYKKLVELVYQGNFFFSEVCKLGKGSTISFLFENSPEIIILNLIAFLAGYRSCPFDVKRDTADVIVKKLRQTKCQTVFYRNDDEHQKLTAEIKEKLPDVTFYEIRETEDLISLFGSSKKEDFPFFDKDNISLILYTSGTTGFPKGAMLSFENIMTGTAQVKEWFDITTNDVFYLVLPLHHINSTIFALSTLCAGGTLIIAPRYSRTHFFADVAQYGATMSSIVPTINLDLLEQEAEFTRVKSSLKLKRIQIGSAPVSAIHALAFYEKYGIKLIQGYGSTETALRVTGVPVNLSEELYKKALTENSVGTALSFNEVKLISKDGSIIEEEGVEGELCVSGKNVMKGYLENEEESVKVLQNGFFHTGDMAYFKIIDGQKFYFISGRIKEIIIKGGVNISPIYIEEKLRAHMSFARDVVVVGFPHYRFGEEIGIVVVPKDNTDAREILEFKNNLRRGHLENISSYEIPSALVIAADSEIAKTATGKVQHTKVRDRFSEALRQDYLNIGGNESFSYRLIEPSEKDILSSALEIHNNVFNPPLSLNEETLLHRAINGFVIGGFDKATKKLVGVLTGFFGDKKLLDHKKWTEITGNGTFSTFHPKGTVAYLCSAASITSVGKKETVAVKASSKNVHLEEVINYIASNKDFTPRFHFKAKGGLESGASVAKILLDANPMDIESRGVVVLFQYPDLSQKEKITFTSDKVGVGLIEAAMMYAKEKGKNTVVAVSRLGEAYKYF